MKGRRAALGLILGLGGAQLQAQGLPSAPSPVQTSSLALAGLAEGRLKAEYPQGAPSLGKGGFFLKAYTYELGFRDRSGHSTHKNPGVRDGADESADSMVLEGIEGTVELNRAAKAITISPFETTREGRRAPLAINGRHKHLDRQR